MGVGVLDLAMAVKGEDASLWQKAFLATGSVECTYSLFTLSTLYTLARTILFLTKFGLESACNPADL